ncbi:MAG: pentapeptide repeat-containing protein [Aggregatilineales bacterium]
MSEQNTLPPENHTETIRNIWKTHQGLYVIAGIIIGLFLYPLLNLIVNDLLNLMQTLVPLVVGIVLTVMFIDQLYQRREEQRRLRDLQEQLVLDAGSSVNLIATRAIDVLRKKGWLNGEGVYNHTHAVLAGTDLSYADLRTVQMIRANLSGTDLTCANLDEAVLMDANLTHAKMINATLVGAILGGAKLNNADLYVANLTKAHLTRVRFDGAFMRFVNLSAVKLDHAYLENVDLRDVRLEGANLQSSSLKGSNLEDALLIGANLRGANLADVLLSNAKFDETTILKDGSLWSEGRDLTEFGAETRDILEMDVHMGENRKMYLVYTFADGTKRRWQQGIGWLDDRYGNPIDH